MRSPIVVGVCAALASAVRSPDDDRGHHLRWYGGTLGGAGGRRGSLRSRASVGALAVHQPGPPPALPTLADALAPPPRLPWQAPPPPSPPKPKPRVAFRRLPSPDPRRLRDVLRRQARTSGESSTPAGDAPDRQAKLAVHASGRLSFLYCVRSARTRCAPPATRTPYRKERIPVGTPNLAKTLHCHAER
jgi:hypothetical protein